MVLRTAHNLLLPPISGRTGRVLAALIKTHRIPQALLFAGIDGIGKGVAAVLLAKAANCETPPEIQPDTKTLESWSCGECRTCHKIDSNNHPDILTVDPKKNQIHIETIRSLITTLSFTPYSAKHRFVLIRSAEKMTPAAGNALLKILEEPPPQTHFLLTAAKVSDLLPTILSRCQITRFQPWPDDVIVSYLVDRHALDKSTAVTTVKLAIGSQIKAIDLAKKDWVPTQQWALDAIEQIDQFPVRQRVVLAERLVQKKIDLETLLIWLKTVILEKIKKQSVAATSSPVNSPAKTAVKQLINRYDIIEDALYFLSTNVNRRMILEKMLMRLAAGSASNKSSIREF